MKKVQILLLGIILGAVPTAFATTAIFSDVSESDWYFESVENLTELGIVEGYEDTTYRPSNDVNRAELATMLDRLTDSINNGCLYLGEYWGLETDAPIPGNHFFLDGHIIEEGIWCEDGIVYSIWE